MAFMNVSVVVEVMSLDGRLGQLTNGDLHTSGLHVRRMVPILGLFPVQSMVPLVVGQDGFRNGTALEANVFAYLCNESLSRKAQLAARS